jgi:prepilin-type N-terminal cleavage/methylation domain-containing protein
MNAKRGFTLIEVLVALGIAASSLVLLMSANHAAMRRTTRAQERVQLEELIETKVSEIKSGIELGSSGQFANMPELSWTVSRSVAQIEGMTTVDELTLKIFNSTGSPSRTTTFFIQTPRMTKK